MNTKIRKVTAVLAAVVISFCSCTFTMTEPEVIVNDFFKGLKTKNEDTLILYTENEDINMLLHSKGNQKDLDKIYDSLFKNFSYKILSVKKDKEEANATIKAEVSNADFSKVLKQYQKKAYQYMEENLYSSNLDQKSLNKKCLSIFADQVKKASDSKKVKTSQVEIHLQKNENYSWDMKLTEEMMETFIGGLIIPL